jgi:hypothetical protein
MLKSGMLRLQAPAELSRTGVFGQIQAIRPIITLAEVTDLRCFGNLERRPRFSRLNYSEHDDRKFYMRRDCGASI